MPFTVEERRDCHLPNVTEAGLEIIISALTPKPSLPIELFAFKAENTRDLGM